MNVKKPIHTPEQCVDKIKRTLDYLQTIHPTYPHRYELDTLEELIREATQSLDELERHLTRAQLEKACIKTLT